MADEAKPDRVGLSGPERMFWEEMDGLGITMEAYIQRTSRDWWPDQFIYRMTLADGSQKTGSIAWDLDSYSKLIAVARGE
jgi:hypothetical protein